jgi:Domain of unknown function (DUF4214)
MLAMKQLHGRRARLELEGLEDRLTPAFGFQGGLVVTHAQVVAVFYGTYWETAAGMQTGAQINNYLSYIVNSPFMDSLSPYGVGRGTVMGVGVIDSGLIGASSDTDADIRNDLTIDIQAGRLPSPSVNTIYLVFLPPNVTVSTQVVSGLVDPSDPGYHSVFASGASSIANYAVIPSSGSATDGALTPFQTLTHNVTVQLADDVTDPQGTGWVDPNTGLEVANMVDSPANVAVLNNYAVAGVWSVLQASIAYPTGSTAPVYNPTQDQIIAADVLGTVAGDFTHSLEYFDDLVGSYYEDYLGRAGGQNELHYWAQSLLLGATNEQVLSQILGSNEYFQKAGGTNQDCVERLYHDMLGRKADSGGEAYWISTLSAGETRQQIALQFDSSSEREAAVVSADYQSLLGRNGSAREVNYWVSQIQSGVTQEQVETIILASPEFLSNSGGSLSGWLTAVFEAVFNRAPDTAGYNAFMRILSVPFAE